MLLNPAKLLLLALVSLVPLRAALDAEGDAWKAVLAQKTKAANLESAAALEKFMADYPQSPHTAAALVEEAVCWFASGRAAQVLHRSTPEAQKLFDKGLELFGRVVSEHASAPEAARARYMQGSSHLFMGQLELAEADTTAVIEKFASDKVYLGKALEQRANLRRNLLQTQPALADLRRWLKEFGSPPSTLERLNGQLARAELLDKPAPPYQPEVWCSREPAPLDSLAGSVIALYFFATWCPHCAEELQFMRDLEHRYAPQGVRFVGVVDHSKGQTPDSVRRYLAEKDMPFAVFQDNGATGFTYHVTATPTLVLIDRAGKVRWCDNPGTLTEWTIGALVREGLVPETKTVGK